MTLENDKYLSKQGPASAPCQASSSSTENHRILTPLSSGISGSIAEHQEQTSLPGEAVDNQRPAFDSDDRRDHTASYRTKSSTTRRGQQQEDTPYTLSHYLSTTERIELLSLGLSATDGHLHTVARAEELLDFILNGIAEQGHGDRKHEGQLSISCPVRVAAEHTDTAHMNPAKE